MPERLLILFRQGVTGRREGRMTRTPSVTTREVRRLFTVSGFLPLAVDPMLARVRPESRFHRFAKSIGRTNYCQLSFVAANRW